MLAHSPISKGNHAALGFKFRAVSFQTKLLLSPPSCCLLSAQLQLLKQSLGPHASNQRAPFKILLLTRLCSILNPKPTIHVRTLRKAETVYNFHQCTVSFIWSLKIIKINHFISSVVIKKSNIQITTKRICEKVIMFTFDLNKEFIATRTVNKGI